MSRWWVLRESLLIIKYPTWMRSRAKKLKSEVGQKIRLSTVLRWWQTHKVKIGEALCHEQQSAVSRASKVEPPIGRCCCDSRQYDRLTTTGWALHFRPPTISIMSVLMYTEQPQSQGHGQGKHTCRKQTSDRIIKCHDSFSLLCARSVYCVGGVVPDCEGFCGELSVVLVQVELWQAEWLYVNVNVSYSCCVVLFLH